MPTLRLTRDEIRRIQRDAWVKGNNSDSSDNPYAQPEHPPYSVADLPWPGENCAPNRYRATVLEAWGWLAAIRDGGALKHCPFGYDIEAKLKGFEPKGDG